jgi:serine/threonine protein phosphatase PrpC
MQRGSHRLQASVATVALAAMFALDAAPAAVGDARAAASQPSAVERLTRQEDARRTELARYDAVARQNAVSAMLGARERALIPHTAEATTATSVVGRASAGDDGFAWGAAAVGLGAGIVAMTALLGCVALLRSTGRLHSV